MKFRRLRNWSKPEECKSLVFFAQLMDEMLFTYSLDTYKPSVINTPTIGVECLQTINDINEGIINAKNIDHLTAELAHNLSNDNVAKEILGEAFSAFLNKLKNPTISPKERKSIIEIIVIQLSPKSYKEVSERLLLEEVTSNTWTTSTTRRLARNYVSLLLYIGFSQIALKNKVQKVFYSGSEQITSNSDIQKLFNILKLEQKKHTVYFIADQIFQEAEPTFSKLGLSFVTEPPVEIGNDPFFRNIQRKLIISSEDVFSFDHHSARENAEEYLKLASSFLNLFHHKEKPTWSNEALVYDGNKSYKVSTRLNPMTKCKDMRAEKAKRMLTQLMSDFDMEDDSFSKFLRSAQLHSTALKSENIENQLLNLWISLESLVPNETKSKDEATIEHIADSVMPFLNISYLDGLIENLLRDLITWDRTITNNHLRGITGKHKLKLAKLLILPEYEGTRLALEGKFRDYTLLKDRFNHIKNIISSPEEIKRTLDNHTQRLQWQFRRIYRTRNNIVHSGKSLPFTALLVEHTHNYLDIIFEHLVYLASKPRKIMSVTQGFRYISMIYDNRYKSITDKKTILTADNIQKLLLWRD